jgi:hypothetical protein
MRTPEKVATETAQEKREKKEQERAEYRRICLCPRCRDKERKEA